MMNEQELYAEQMKLWFAEHERIGAQIERAVQHNEELANLNREQLDNHNKRMELATKEYNLWATENGMSLYQKG
jgi:hypothetical protein